MEIQSLPLVEIIFAVLIFAFLFFRKKDASRKNSDKVLKFELKLSGGTFTPDEIRVPFNQPAQLLIYRYDSEPSEELFEIDELQIYELLPAGHTTIIAFNPQKRGKFPLVLAAEKQAAWLIVE